VTLPASILVSAANAAKTVVVALPGLTVRALAAEALAASTARFPDPPATAKPAVADVAAATSAAAASSHVASPLFDATVEAPDEQQQLCLLRRDVELVVRLITAPLPAAVEPLVRGALQPVELRLPLPGGPVAAAHGC